MLCLILCILISGFTIPITPAPDILIRNDTSRRVSYRIALIGGQGKTARRSLEPGMTHTLPYRGKVSIHFHRSSKTIRYLISPGNHYCFRHNEWGVLELFYLSPRGEYALDLGPYLATPREVVQKMLEIAKPEKDDVLVDLGSGDGRIVVMAASLYGIRARGIEIDPDRVMESERLAREKKVAHLATFTLQDLTAADFSDATVVTLYLPTRANAYIRPLLERQLRKGTRIVCHDYPVPGWESKTIGTAEMLDNRGEKHCLYLYKR